ncbi:MAG TPA: DUF302 domain-containing protein [Gaiellales bacterium]|nr:DUF302 domain-containing protein [Gaiellales bacterium]
MADDGLVTVASAFPVSETVDRLAAAAEAAGLRVFARVDHAAGAAEAGMHLRPTELILVGNPRGGTPLMQDGQTAGIDLPLRALAWEDADGQAWVTTNDTAWIAARHGLGEASAAAAAAVSAGLARIVGEATAG